jgi:Leucine-rich repeat (LRR) protein
MKTDQQILEQLEKEGREKFEQLSLKKFAEGFINGYSIDENGNITCLSLFSLRISDISFLTELKNLTTLDLSSNQISDYSFLTELI